MKTKKGSKAYKAKLSTAQKRSWAKRRREAKLAFEEVPMAEIPPPTKEQLAHAASYRIVDDREADVQEIRDWINDAPTQIERQRRKIAMMGVMYGAQSKFPGSLGDKVEQQWHEGTSSHRWSAEAGCQQSNIPKEDTEQYFVKPGDWRLDNGGDPSAKPFNPDAMFQQPPIHPDPVNHPAHYPQHPSGVECITITEHFNFNRGNAIKYIWRAGEKSSVSLLEDLRKARWYLDREISRLEKEAIR